MDDPTLGGWRRLGCAILVQAHRDVYSTNGRKAMKEAGIPESVGLAGDARAFLESDGARWLVGLLDLDPAGHRRALAELPTVKPVQLVRV